jgi:16S rRNA (adenine1518-N6/adenine1519-N6)-dimethyltransferase
MVSARSARQRELGQNFLVDRNILDVIERLAQLSPADVVLEIGGGPGVLSTRLASRVSHLHVVEVDERLRDRLTAELAPFTNVSLHFADALELDLAALAPAPAKIVANLPYGVAATVILRTIEDLPEIEQWVVMVQREVGERFAAAPGTSAYGVPSVLAQLACEVKVLRRVSRTVFRPVPNVDSVLLGLRRIGPAADAGVSALVHAAFAHRRKAMAGSLALAGARRAGGAPRGSGAGAVRYPPDVRDRTRAALVELGHPPDERAERLAPPEFRALAALIAP